MQVSPKPDQEESAPNSLMTGARGWIFVIILLGLAFLLRWLLDPLWKERLPFATFFLAFLVITHFTEAAPSIFAMVAGFLFSAWFFAAPRHTFLISATVDRVNTVFYFAVCFLILFYTRRSRRFYARERAAGLAAGRLAAIVESSDDAIIGRSLDGKILSWNAGAIELYGYTETEALGQPLGFPLPGEDGNESAALLAQVARGEHIKQFETKRQRKDGSWVEVSLSISPIRNAAGRIIGASSIARDIAERKLAERERERMLEELQRLLGEVKTLTGLLPICSYCKKIRDGEGHWNRLEEFIGKRSSANFTHSVCPECADHHYGDFLRERSPGQ